MVRLTFVYINETGERIELKYDEEEESYDKSRKNLYKTDPEAVPFYIISKPNIQYIFENSIYPTVEEVEELFKGKNPR